MDLKIKITELIQAGVKGKKPRNLLSRGDLEPVNKYPKKKSKKRPICKDNLLDFCLPDSDFGGRGEEQIDQDRREVLQSVRKEIEEIQHWLDSKDYELEEHNVSNTASAENEENLELKRKETVEADWSTMRNHFYSKYISSQAPTPSFLRCYNCEDQLGSAYVRCKTCVKELCAYCDEYVHSDILFHQRLLMENRSFLHLMPNEFVSNKGRKFLKDLPVPCFTYRQCKNCQVIDNLSLRPGKTNKIVVTLKGRFELKSAMFICKGCRVEEEAEAEDYISSGFWPALSKGGKYLFSEELLEFWNHLKFNAPGTSQVKFVKVLEILTNNEQRYDVVNRQAFDKASREYDFMMHLLDVRLKMLAVLTCRACGEHPLACHCDGNKKLYRFESAGSDVQDGDPESCLREDKSLFQDTVISADEDVINHCDKINAVVGKKKGSESCGGAEHKAARSDSSMFKGLDVTGVVVNCCRHGAAIGVCNMYAGETFRHTHFLHKLAYEKGYIFFSNDVSCSYWPFAEKVSAALPEFAPLTSEMTPFLGRLHGQTHEWPCRVLNDGGWKKGAADGSGEEAELLFSVFGRFAVVTKHMTRANRRDHLSAALLYWNKLKEMKMSKFLTKRFSATEKKLRINKSVLRKLMKKRNLTEEDLPKMKESLIAIALLCRGVRINSKTSLDIATKSLEGYHMAIQVLYRRLKRESDSCKSRTHFRRKIALLKAKAVRLIQIINDIKSDKDENLPMVPSEDEMEISSECGTETSDEAKLSETSENSISEDDGSNGEGNYNPYVTYKDFENGTFPWLPTSKCNFQEDFKLVNSWMARNRCIEEIVQIKLEMAEFVRSLRNSICCLEEALQPLGDETDETTMGRSIIISKEIVRLRRLLSYALQDFIPYM